MAWPMSPPFRASTLRARTCSNLATFTPRTSPAAFSTARTSSSSPSVRASFSWGTSAWALPIAPLAASYPSAAKAADACSSRAVSGDTSIP